MKYLFCTDGHLSSKRPIARTEKTDSEYIDNQLAKRKQMLEYAKVHGIKTILDGGDFLQYWRMENSNELLIKTYELFSQYEDDIEYMVNIGNHDLPYHNYANINQSLLGVFEKMKVVKIEDSLQQQSAFIQFVGYGTDLSTVKFPLSGSIAVIHENIFEHTVPPYMTGYTAHELIKLMPKVDLFLCGHNHEQFLYREGDKTVVNGGSIMRLTTRQADYKPKFYEIEIDNDTGRHYVLPIEFDILPNMISDEHLKSNKIQTFVQSTQSFADGTEVFDFRRDVELELNKRETGKDVRRIVNDCLGAIE